MVAASARSFGTRKVSSHGVPRAGDVGKDGDVRGRHRGQRQKAREDEREPHRICTGTSIVCSSISEVLTTMRSVHFPGDGTVSAVAT